MNVLFCCLSVFSYIVFKVYICWVFAVSSAIFQPRRRRWCERHEGVGTSERRERSERRAADPRSGYKSAHNQKLSTQAALHTQLTARLHVCGLTQMRLDNKKMSIHISGSDATWSRPPPACPEGRTGNYFVCWFTIMKMRTIRGRGWEKKERRQEESSQCATPCCLLLLVSLIVTWS